MAKMTFTNWAENKRAAWMGDFGNREHLVPGGARIDPAQFVATDAVTVTTTAAAAAGATALAVAALAGPIPSGTLLRFAAGVYARTTAAAVAGATSLAVEALPAAVANGAIATYAGSGTKNVVVPSGTYVGRTIAERDAGIGFGPWAAGDDEAYLLAFDVSDAPSRPDCDLYRRGSIVKENFLPGYGTPALSAAALADIRSRYAATRGSN